MDDFHLKNLMHHPDNPYNIIKSPLDMFNFFDGDPETTSMLMDHGLPWWVDANIKAGFWRPLTAITHWLDYIIFSGDPMVMHLHSILWYAAAAVLVAVYYRRITGLTIAAGLAALMWVLDDTHGTPVGFISNRNALLACFFGMLTLIAHDNWYKHKQLKWKIIATVSLAASLLSAEAGIATCAYLFAYVVFLESSNWRQKLYNLAPYATVVIIWRIAWSLLGYGIVNVGLYVDPVRQPLLFVSEMWHKAILLLTAQLVGIASDIAIMLSAKALSHLVVIELFLLIILAAMFIPVIRKDKIARFWACGMLLSVLPCCATFPCDRMLVFVSIGAMGLLGQFIVCVFSNKDVYKSKRALRVISIVAAVLFLFSNIFLSPGALTVKTMYPLGPPKLTEKIFVPPIEDEKIVNQDLVVVNPPTAFLALASPYMFDLSYKNRPKLTRALCSSFYGPTEITRVDKNSLSIRPAEGYMAFTLDRLFRGNNCQMELGQKVHLTGMEVEVTELTDDNRPAEAVFRFDKPLEDESFRWLKWGYGQYESYTPPAVGQTEIIKAGTLKGGIMHLLKSKK